MLWKILTFIGFGLMVWGAVRRLTGGAAGPPPARRDGRPVEDLARCPACGAWVPQGERCACATPPTP